MEITDANIVLRYLLNDNEILSKKSVSILENSSVNLPFEVCAEVVYVLEKVYAVSRENIQNALTLLLEYPNIATSEKTVLIEALKIYHIENVDFVDAILVAYNHKMGATIHSCDKKVNKLCL